MVGASTHGVQPFPPFQARQPRNGSLTFAPEVDCVVKGMGYERDAFVVD